MIQAIRVIYKELINPLIGDKIKAKSSDILNKAKASAKPNIDNKGNKNQMAAIKAAFANITISPLVAMYTAMAHANPTKCFPLVTIMLL